MSEGTRRWREEHLLIAGEGEGRQALEAAIAGRGLQDHVTLLSSPLDVARLPALAVTCSSFRPQRGSIRLRRSQGIAAVVPTAAFRSPGFTEFVKGGLHGRLAGCFYVLTLINAVTDLLANPEKSAGNGPGAPNSRFTTVFARE